MCLECQCQKQASLLPSQLFPFPSIVLTVLENDAARGKTCEATEYKLSKAMIQNCFYGTYAIPPVTEVLKSNLLELSFGLEWELFDQEHDDNRKKN